MKKLALSGDVRLVTRAVAAARCAVTALCVAMAGPAAAAAPDAQAAQLAIGKNCVFERHPKQQ